MNYKLTSSFVLFLILFFVVLSVIWQCDGGKRSQDLQIFRYNESAGIATLDPAFARDQAHNWVCNQLYNQLVALNDSLHVVPELAHSWSISEDARTYTFHLRRGVYFHDDSLFHGTPRSVHASDVVYSLQRILDPATASPGAWVLAMVDSTSTGHEIRALNDSTVSIRLRQPFPPFLGILSMPYCSVIPEEAVSIYGKDFRKHPVGTGPFYLRNWVEGIKMVLTRNPNYFQYQHHRQLPLLDGVAISFLLDKMTAFMEFAKGNFDMISGIDPTYKDELLNRQGELRQKYHDRFTLLSAPFLNTEYLAFFLDTLPGGKSSPLHDKAVRKAINLGFDRHKMLRFLRNNIGTAGTAGIIPAGMPAHDPTADYGYDYNPDLARDILSAAGYNAQHPVPPITLVTTPDYLDMLKYIQSQVEQIGITLNIEVSPAAAVRDQKAHGKLMSFRASWIADYPDEENYLSLFTTANFTPMGPNYTHFSSGTFDSLFDKTMNETDERSRTIAYRALDSLIMEEVPVAVLYYDKAIRVIQADVKGMTINPMNMLNLETVYKTSEQ